MVSIENIREILPAPGGNYEKLVHRQNVYDIVREVLNQHKLNASDADKISRLFWQGNDIDTANCIFDFCKKYMPYEWESANVQTVKSLPQILHDAQIKGVPQDCKHYAIFTVSLLDSLKRQGYPVDPFYRFASDVKGQRVPKHVFAVINTNDGEYWIDPVLKYANQFYNYYYILDKKPPMLYRVSGLENVPPYIENVWSANIGSHGRGKAKLKKFEKHLSNDISKVNPARVLLKVGIAPGRNAFLEIIKLNAFDIGRKLYLGAQNPAMRARIEKLWTHLGGRFPSLAKAINMGYTRSRHGKVTDQNTHNISGWQMENDSVGFVLATAMAAALPVIAAFAGILKELNVNMTQVKRASDGGIKTLAISHNATGGDHADGTKTTATKDDAGNDVLTIHQHTNTDHETQSGQVPDLNIPPGQENGGMQPTTARQVAPPDTGADDDGTEPPQKSGAMVPGGGGGTAEIMTFVKAHKTPILLGGLAVVGLIIGKQFIPTKKRR